MRRITQFWKSGDAEKLILVFAGLVVVVSLLYLFAICGLPLAIVLAVILYLSPTARIRVLQSKRVQHLPGFNEDSPQKMALAAAGYLFVVSILALRIVPLGIFSNQPPNIRVQEAGEDPLIVRTTPQPTESKPAPPTPSPEQRTPPIVAKIGTRVKTDQWSVVVWDARLANWLSWKGQALEPNGQWLIVYGEAQNLTNRRINLFPSDFSLKVPSFENEIRPHIEATHTAGLAANVEHTVAGFNGMGVEANNAVPLIIAFDVPVSTQEAFLQVEDAGFDIGLGQVQQLAMLRITDPTRTPTSRPTLTSLIAVTRQSPSATPTPRGRIDSTAAPLYCNATRRIRPRYCAAPTTAGSATIASICLQLLQDMSADVFM